MRAPSPVASQGPQRMWPTFMTESLLTRLLHIGAGHVQLAKGRHCCTASHGVTVMRWPCGVMLRGRKQRGGWREFAYRQSRTTGHGLGLDVVLGRRSRAGWWGSIAGA